MKKILSIISVCISCMMCLLLSVACAGTKPLLDIRKAGDNLRERGYDVEIEYDKKSFGIEGAIVAELYAKRGDESICIIEYENSKLSQLDMKEWKIEYDVSSMHFEYKMNYYKTILDVYRDQLTSSQIIDYEDEIQEYNQYKKEMQEKYKTIGQNGVYFWYASSVQVLEDTK